MTDVNRINRILRRDQRMARCPVTGKQRFRTEQSALNAMAQIKASRRANPVVRATLQRVYECDQPECGGWHITSQPPRESE